MIPALPSLLSGPERGRSTKYSINKRTGGDNNKIHDESGSARSSFISFESGSSDSSI